MRIRCFEPSDLDALVPLYIACFREPPWLELFTPAEVRADFTTILDYPEHVFLVALDDNDCPSGAGIGFHVCRKPDVYRLLTRAVDHQSFYVSELFVRVDERGRGICQQLTTALLAQAGEQGFTHASVRTSVDQPIIRRLFVNRLGFSEPCTETVVSRKVINGVACRLPDTRVLMVGQIRSLYEPPTTAAGSSSGSKH